MGLPTRENWQDAGRMVAGSVDAARVRLRLGASNTAIRGMDYDITMTVYNGVPPEERDEFVRYLAASLACAVVTLAHAGATEQEIMP